MFKNTESKNSKGEATRRHLMDQALKIFLSRGFEKTTLRDLQKATGLSLGSFYYYFPSKESIIFAFYEENFSHFKEEAIKCLERGGTRFDDLFEAVLETRIRTMAPQREIFLQLASAATDPQSPLSPFSPSTEEVRNATIGIFHGLVARSDIKVPRTIAPYLPHLLWFAMMGVILFWTFDQSPGQSRTLKLIPILSRNTSRLLRALNLPIVGKHILPFKEILALFPDLKPYEPKINIGATK
ncbi:MAG: TetR/AcrR family transcriptional regulator [Bdellovibrionota bacterium]